MVSPLDFLGGVGGFCFAYCGVPAAYATIRGGRAVAPLSVAGMIFVGALTMYGYLLGTYGFNWLLAVNYAVEAVSWGIVCAYHARSG